jgi:hypothetical protein
MIYPSDLHHDLSPYYPIFNNRNMSNATFTRDLSRPLTHANLTTHYLAHSNTLRSRLPSIPSPRDVARAERVLEMLLMGIRLCHRRIGSPAEINALVDRLIGEIQRERISFIPDPFAEYERGKGEVEVYEDGLSETEEVENMMDNEDEDEHGPDNFLSLFAPRNASLVSPLSSQAHIYPSSPSPSPASSTRSASSPNTVNIWSELVDSLNETLYGYISLYAHTPHKYSYYQPTINLLHDALRIARQRPHDVHPNDVWEELEDVMLKIREAREEDEEMRD